MLTAGHWFQNVHSRSLSTDLTLKLGNQALETPLYRSCPLGFEAESSLVHPTQLSMPGCFGWSGKAIFEEDCLEMSLSACSVHDWALRSSQQNLTGSFPPALPCPWVYRREVTCPGVTQCPDWAYSPFGQKNRSYCVQTWASVFLKRAFSATEPGLRGSGSKCPTSCRGFVLSKSRGGEKVKQTLNAAASESQSGGLPGDTVCPDLGFPTRLDDGALQILGLTLDDPLATTLP